MARVEQKQLGVGPDVARIRRDEERQVADQPDVFGARMGLQSCALPEEQELNETNAVHLAGQIPPRLVQRRGHAAHEIVRPVEITGAVVSRFQRSEQCVVVQPVRMLFDEVLEFSAQIRSRAGPKVLPCGLEQWVLELRDCVEVDGRGRKRGARAVRRPYQLVLDEPVGADQQWVAGERR